MRKLLLILVIFLLLFSVGSLILGIMLFEKREMLKGRTQKLENMLMALSVTTIEAKGAEAQVVTYPSKDISECTAEVLDTPQKSDFWDGYKGHLEAQDLAKLDLAPKRNQLRQYYKVNEVTGQKDLDPESGAPITKGPGTMQAVLDEVMEKAGAQYARLNETRQQLSALREELVRTITELNERKQTLRQRLAEIVQLNQKVTQLEAKVRQLEAQVSGLEEEKRQLQGQVTDLQNSVATLQQATNEWGKQYRELRVKYDALLKGPRVGGGDVTGGGEQELARQTIEPGEKGSVVSANPKWHFMVMQLSERFIAELVGSDPARGPLLPVDLYVRRAAPDGRFVTKVRLTQVRKDERIGVCDVLTDWQQLPIEKGDTVFYGR